MSDSPLSEAPASRFHSPASTSPKISQTEIDPITALEDQEKPLQKRKREDNDDGEGRSNGWHPRYAKDPGPEVTLESDDGCLFTVRRSLLASHSAMFEKWLAGMKEDWVLHLHTNQKVVALLLDLMATPSEIATMADLDDLTIATTDHAARSFQVTTVYPVIDRQMEVLLATRPFEMLKIASEQDLPDLARRSIKHMTSDSIWEYCGTSEKRDEFLAGLRPDWQVQFYKTLLLASTRSCRKLESEIRSIVKLDSNVFRLAAEEEGENVKPDPTSGSPWTSKRADGR